MKPRDRKRPVLVNIKPSRQAASRQAESGQTPSREKRSRQTQPGPSRRSRIILLGACALVLPALAVGIFLYVLPQRPSAEHPPAARPLLGNGLNVLLITVDTTRADYLGCYGRPGGRTPNIDRLAQEGALFERCIASAPLTGPSHASILTGNHPFVHGVRRNSAVPLASENISLAEVLKDSGYATAATVASFVLNRQFGFAQGFDYFHDVSQTSVDDPQSAERKGDEISRDAISLLRTLAPAPFFLWVHYYDPHHPYETRRSPPYTTAEAYEDEIAFMDEQIGLVLGELENLGLAQRTIVVLVGDHGEGLGEHGESQHAYLLYNSTQHVPLIVRCPEAVVPGTSLAEVVRTIDVPPTILALLGLPPVEQTQGVSLARCLRGEMAVPTLEAYSESFEAHAQFGVARLRSLMDQQWKYILAPKPELYAMADSLAETNSVIAEHPDVAARLRERLRVIVAEAPPPARPDSDAAATLSDADRARLESLGYAGTAVGPDEVNGPELERFEPEGANPMDFTAQFELTVQAGDLLQVRDYAAATPLLQQVLAILPDAPRPTGLVATALAAQGRPHEAIPIYERVLKLIPEDTYLRGSYGIALMQVGRTQEAADNLRIVLLENPRSARVLHNLAIALTQLGRLAEADQNLQLALEVEPRNPRVLHTLGILRARQNRLAEAEQYLVQALQIDPSFRQCQEDLERMRANMRGRQP